MAHDDPFSSMLWPAAVEVCIILPDLCLKQEGSLYPYNRGLITTTLANTKNRDEHFSVPTGILCETDRADMPMADGSVAENPC